MEWSLLAHLSSCVFLSGSCLFMIFRFLETPFILSDAKTGHLLSVQSHTRPLYILSIYPKLSFNSLCTLSFTIYLGEFLIYALKTLHFLNITFIPSQNISQIYQSGRSSNSCFVSISTACSAICCISSCVICGIVEFSI